MPVSAQAPDPSVKEKSFNELLAESANRDKPSLIASVLQAFREGEPSAIKLVSQALLESQFSETNQLPISDERFEEIIFTIADHIRNA